MPELVKEAGRGEEIVIMENERPVAKLAGPPAEKITEQKGWPVIGMYKGQIKIAPAVGRVSRIHE